MAALSPGSTTVILSLSNVGIASPTPNQTAASNTKMSPTPNQTAATKTNLSLRAQRGNLEPHPHQIAA
jgi:hypothetical protein